MDPAAPKKCDVIVLSGRKERCEAAVEALKVRNCNRIFYILLEGTYSLLWSFDTKSYSSLW